MKKILIGLLGGLFVLPITGAGQSSPRIWVEYDTAGMIGDAMNLRFHCESPNPENVNFPFLQGQISADLSLIPSDSLRIDTVSDAHSGLKTMTVSYLFSSYREGLYTMPSFCFEYPAGDSLRSYCTDTGIVRFYAPEVDTTASIKDIAPAFNVGKKELLKEYWDKYDIYLWIALATALLCVAIVYICKKWKRKETLFVPKKPSVPPVIRALASLKQLKEKQLWQNNLIKEYYTELTDILRLYLSEAMEIPAVEMTNEELRSALKKRFPAKSWEAQNLMEVLDTATLVKFAKVLPGAAEHENCYAVVQEFLETQKKAQDAAKVAESLPKADTESEPTAGSIPQTSASGIQPSRPVSEMTQEPSDDSCSQADNKAESKEEKEAPTEN